MPKYKIKVFYMDIEEHEEVLPLIEALDLVAEWYAAADTLSDIVNSKALTFSISEVLI